MSNSMALPHHAKGDPIGFTVGSAIKITREARTRLSARALSLRAGLSESYIGKIEAGTVEPSFRSFSKIAVALDMNPQEIALLVTQEAERP